jgi:hypothetical protein
LRDTYRLESGEEGRNQYMGRKQVINGHSLPDEHRERDKLRDKKEVS